MWGNAEGIKSPLSILSDVLHTLCPCPVPQAACCTQQKGALRGMCMSSSDAFYIILGKNATRQTVILHACFASIWNLHITAIDTHECVFLVIQKYYLCSRMLHGYQQTFPVRKALQEVCCWIQPPWSPVLAFLQCAFTLYVLSISWMVIFSFSFKIYLKM